MTKNKKLNNVACKANRRFGFTKRASENFLDKLVSTKAIMDRVSKYFRYYQMDMWNEVVKSVNSNEKRVAKMFKSGTGTGKTEVFKYIPSYFMAHRREAGITEGMTFALVCHRISLIKDLGKRILPAIAEAFGQDNKVFATDSNKFIKFYDIFSGKSISVSYAEDPNFTALAELDQAAEKLVKNQKINSVHVASMTREKLMAEIEENKKKGIHSMFICLYQSLGEYGTTLMKDLDLDLCICDEIHALNAMGEKTFFNCCEVFKRTKYNYFFSATLQMDKNDERYGNDFQKAQEHNNDNNND